MKAWADLEPSIGDRVVLYLNGSHRSPHCRDDTRFVTVSRVVDKTTVAIVAQSIAGIRDGTEIFVCRAPQPPRPAMSWDFWDFIV